MSFGRFLFGDPPHHIPNFRRIEHNQALLLEDYAYERPDGIILVARKGLIYDGASIPRLLWGLSTHPFADDVIGPATIHDEFCKLGREGHSPFKSEDVHYNFYLGLRCIGVSAWRARARWIAVRSAGPRFGASSNG